MKVGSTPIEIIILIMITALTLVWAALLFFVKRYISQNDDHHKSAKEDIKKLKETVHQNTVVLGNGLQRMNDAASSIEQSSLRFQQHINAEILAVHRATTQVKSDVESIGRTVSDLGATVEKHQKSLSLGAQALVKQREEIAGIKTTITKISPDAVLIGQKKGNRR